MYNHLVNLVTEIYNFCKELDISPPFHLKYTVCTTLYTIFAFDVIQLLVTTLLLFWFSYVSAIQWLIII